MSEGRRRKKRFQIDKKLQASSFCVKKEKSYQQAEILTIGDAKLCIFFFRHCRKKKKSFANPESSPTQPSRQAGIIFGEADEKAFWLGLRFICGPGAEEHIEVEPGCRLPIEKGRFDGATVL